MQEDALVMSMPRYAILKYDATFTWQDQNPL